MFKLGWRSWALRDRQAEAELEAIWAENERAEETRAAEVLAEREDQ